MVSSASPAPLDQVGLGLVDHADAPLAALPDALTPFPVELAGDGTRLVYRGGNGEGKGRAEVAQLAQALARVGIGFTSLDIHDSSLEDIFVGLLGKQAEAA